MEELFTNPINPRRTKSIQINNIQDEIDNRIKLDAELQKLPQQDISACNVCGCPDQSNINFETNGYKWVKCPECTHVYKAQMPEQNALNKCFMDKTTQVYLHEASFDYRIENITTPKYDFMMRYYKGEPGRWLDLATGVADMPFILKKYNWDFQCTELNTAFVDFADKSFGIRPHQKTLFEFYDMFKQENLKPYDVIGAFGYYDMLPDPLEHCKTINRMLKIGGFHGVNIPNSKSLSGALVEVLPHSSLRMSTPITISSFTYDSIMKMLDLAGFKVKGILWHGLDIHELIVRMIELSPEFKDSNAYNILYENVNEFQGVVDKKRISDLLLICAQKVRDV